MNNTNQPAPEQATKPPERLHDTAGMMLRKARESANLTHAAVGEALHLTVHYIKALENDDYSKLPGATFVKGYLRAYARYLKLDVNAVLASYEKNNVSAEELNNRTESLSRSQKRHDQTFRWAVVTAIIVVLGVAAGWWFVGKDQVAPKVVTTSPQTPAQLEANRPAATTTAARTAGQNIAQASSATAQVFTSSPVAAPGFATSGPAQDAGVVSSSTGQVLSLADNPSQVATTNFAVAAETAALTGTAVPNSTATNPATNNTVLPADNTLGVAETALPPSAANAASVPASEMTLAAIPDQENVALTVTPTADGARQVTLISAGTDMVQLYFKGTSWVEVDDGAQGRLYNETLTSGDAITLHGTAPFKVLLGDATQVELTFNSQPIDLSSQIRSDKTARFSLAAAATASENVATSPGANP